VIDALLPLIFALPTAAMQRFWTLGSRMRQASHGHNRSSSNLNSPPESRHS
jgi:hypothetical protein